MHKNQMLDIYFNSVFYKTKFIDLIRTNRKSRNFNAYNIKENHLLL